MSTRAKTRKMATVGLLAALSVIMVMFKFPFTPAPYLEYDPADIPILLGTYIYGGTTGFIITIIASAIQAFTVSAASGAIGFIMHVAATGSMCLAVGAVYNKKHKSTGRLIAASIVGPLVMTVVMVAFNIVLTPIFLGVPRNEVIAGLATITIPFNLMKASINTVIALILNRALKTVIGSYED